MRVIQFEICGKMAHFRKYYSNSTALSHYLPPAATIKGILAGLLGQERDEYYELFANRNCQVAVGVLSDIRKITQTMNLLKVEAPKDLTGAGLKRTQNNTEWIIPDQINKGVVRYLVAVHHNDAAVMQQLQNLLCTGEQVYHSAGISLALGSAQCLGWVENACCCDAQEYISKGEETAFYSAVPVRLIADLPVDNPEIVTVVKEESITEFDSQRYITEGSKQDIILTTGGNPLRVQLLPNTPYWHVAGKNMIFLG